MTDAAGIASRLALAESAPKSPSPLLSRTAEMSRLLNRLFREPLFRAGKPGLLTIHAIRILGPDAAVVSSGEPPFNQTDSRTGRPVLALHTNELFVMQKRHGRWLIVNDLTSDESHGI